MLTRLHMQLLITLCALCMCCNLVRPFPSLEGVEDAGDGDSPVSSNSGSADADRDGGEPDFGFPDVETCDVWLQPGDDIQSVVDQNPDGTLYCLRSGTYREQSVVPGDGDHFFGESGAVLSGAKVLEGFDVDGEHWYVDGQDSEISLLPYETAVGDGEGNILADQAGQGRHEELFVDDRRLIQVEQKSELEPGHWWFDYDNDRVYLADDPSGFDTIELAVTELGFHGPAQNVRLENLILEKYANDEKRAVIRAEMPEDVATHQGWTVRFVTLRHNHGTAIRVGGDTLISNVHIHDNGIHAITGFDDGGLVQVRDSHLHDNGLIPFESEWRRSAFRFTGARVSIENNLVEDHPGFLLWLNFRNIDASVRANRFHRSLQAFLVRSEGNSRGIEFLGNEFVCSPTVENSVRTAIRLIRPTGDLVIGNTARNCLTDFQVYGEAGTNSATIEQNDFLADGESGSFVSLNCTGDGGETGCVDSADYTIDENVYRIANNLREESFFSIFGQSGSLAQWQEAGYDLDATVVEPDETVPAPDGIPVFSESLYGAR